MPISSPPPAPSAAEVRPLLVGATIPEASLTDIDGKVFDLKAAVAKKPTVLIFYRGGWCPFCNLQMGQLQQAQPELSAMGYQILAISPDKPEELRKSLDKHKLTYTLLSDSTMATSRAFGVAFTVDDKTLTAYKGYGIDLDASSGGKSDHQLPVPSVFVIGKDGVVNFTYVNPNYKVRLAPSVLLAAAKAGVSP